MALADLAVAGSVDPEAASEALARAVLAPAVRADVVVVRAVQTLARSDP